MKKDIERYSCENCTIIIPVSMLMDIPFNPTEPPFTCPVCDEEMQRVTKISIIEGGD